MKNTYLYLALQIAQWLQLTTISAKTRGGGLGVVAGTLQAPLSNLIFKPIIVILQEKGVASPS